VTPVLLGRGRALASGMGSAGTAGILSVMLPAADEAFLASAPSRFVDTIEVGLPAATVWAELTRDATLDWCRGLKIT
jgi:hypothetical protein